jgi:Protein of unknown function (DUF3179)
MTRALLIALLAAVALSCGRAEDRPATRAPEPEATPSGRGTPSPAVAPTPSVAPSNTSSRSIDFGAWPNTDFSKTTVPLAEVERACDDRDCVWALDANGAVEMTSSRPGRATFMPARELVHQPWMPVAYVTVEGRVRGYPLHVLLGHEVVNDRIGETSFVVTYCPLSNAALAFDRRVDGQVLDFGISGYLRKSTLVMWDRQTESWWQQATGEGIVGELAGKQLTGLPMAVIAYADFAAAFPEAEILTENTGAHLEYGYNPYAGYDARGATPPLFTSEPDPRLDLLERVLSLEQGSSWLALPFSRLSPEAVANVVVGDRAFVVFWAQGAVSVLDQDYIVDSRDIGAAVAFDPTVDGRRLTFQGAEPGQFTDFETGTTWDITGRAIAGPLEGHRLPAVVHTTQFWFAWAAFHPETAIWAPPPQSSGE